MARGKLIQLERKDAIATIYVRCEPPAAVQAIAVVIDQTAKEILLKRAAMFSDCNSRDRTVELISFVDSLPNAIIDPDTPYEEDCIASAQHADYVIDYHLASNFEHAAEIILSECHVTREGFSWALRVGDTTYTTASIPVRVIQTIKNRMQRR